MIYLNTSDQIIASIGKESSIHLGIPKSEIDLIVKLAGEEYLSLLRVFGGIELSGDFLFLPAVKLKGENLGRSISRISLWEEFLLFACSGNGDAWVIKNNQVYFLDHDQGDDAELKDMKLDIFQWLQLADLMNQFESSLSESDILKVQKLLLEISPNLDKDYPYAIEI